MVFTDATLTAIAERRPAQRAEELIAIAGIGPRKLGLYGDAVLALVAGGVRSMILRATEKSSAN